MLGNLPVVPRNHPALLRPQALWCCVWLCLIGFAIAARANETDTTLTQLSDIESRLGLGEAATDEETALVVKQALTAQEPLVRARAVAVLPWLSADVALAPLTKATQDSDARVKTTAVDGLAALRPRVTATQQAEIAALATTLTRDSDDTCACAAAQLLGHVHHHNSQDLAPLLPLTAELSDVRYGCFAHAQGLPPRPFINATPPVAEATRPNAAVAVDDAVLPLALLLTSSASIGAIAVGAIPTALFPAQDVMHYGANRTRLTREELSVAVEASAAIAGSLAFAGVAYGISRLTPVTASHAVAFASTTAAGTLLGASGKLVFGFDAGATNFAIAGGALVGSGLGFARLWLAPPTLDDHALVAASSATLGLVGLLGAFAAVPVGYPTVFSATRGEFGIGVAAAAAATGALLAQAGGVFFDVPRHRSFGAASGGLVGGTALTLLTLVLLPADFTLRSRVASGVGLVGLVGGAAVGAWLFPASWLGSDAEATNQAAVVALNARDGQWHVQLGLPGLAIDASRPKATAVLGNFLAATF